MAESKEHKKEDVIEIPVGKYLSKMGKNPWIISTVVLAIALVVVLIIFMKGGGATTTSVSSGEAGQNLVSFVNGLGQGNAVLVSSEKEGALYKVTVKYNGQDVPVFVTLDGKYMVPQPVPLSSDGATPQDDQPVQQDIPKSDKPVVELFVMSYCPYGTQMEKGILPVLSLMKDKINFTLRYTHFTLHGEKEDTENFRQLCIRQEQGAKFLPYIQCTLNSTDIYNPGNVTQCMKNLGIDSKKVDSCIATKAQSYYDVDSELSQGYGVQGSPTLVINGVQSQSGRSPAAVLGAVCAAFNNAPAECNSQLPTETPSAGFGFNKGSSSDAAAINCGF